MSELQIKAKGSPNYQKFAETWAMLLAARTGNEATEVRVTRRRSTAEQEVRSQGVASA